MSKQVGVQKGEGVARRETKKMSRHVHHVRLRFSSSWSDLPPELLQSIADRMNPNSDDLRSFRSICNNWRSAIKPPLLTLSPHLPHQIPPLSHPLSVAMYREFPFIIVSTAVYLVRHASTAASLVAVEQAKPGKVRLFHPLTRLSIIIEQSGDFNNFPKIVRNLSSVEISKGFNLRLPDSYVTPRMAAGFWFHKVLLWPCPYRKSPGIEHSSLMVLDHSDHTGDLVCLRLKGSYVSKKITYGHISKFDDIVIKKGKVMVVDRLGRLYRIEYKRIEATTVCVAVSRFKGYGERRKRLLWDSGTHKLYLVVREHVMEGTKFKVYVHNSIEGVWDELPSLGNRVLFVSCDTCFFVQATDLPGFKGNCIVFPKDCFPAYSGTNNPDGSLFQGAARRQFVQVGVHNYGEGENFKLISDCPGFSDALWPPPQWIWEDTSSPYVESAEQVEVSSELEKKKSQAKEVKTESCDRMNVEQQSSLADRGTAYALGLGKSFLELETQTQSKDIPDSTPSSALELPAEGRDTCTANSQVHEEELEVEAPGETHSDLPVRASNTFLTQTFGSNNSRVTFEGVDIRSDLVPTLENIWAKHGNVIGGSAIHNGDIIARALESLAMVVQILQGNSGRSLDICQADYMSSALRDLQFMHFSVEWLVPFVEKALAVHKSRPLLDSLSNINKTKAQAKERRLKLLDELAKVDELVKGLEEEGTLVKERIPITGPLDLDECLGKGLC